MLWIVEKIAKMCQIRDMFNGSGIMDEHYDHGLGYLLWTAQEYELLNRLCEYAVNERDLWNQRFPDEFIQGIHCVDALMSKPERIMLWIVEKIAKMCQIRDMFNGSGIMDEHYDLGPGYLIWTAQEYELLKSLCEYAVNERNLWNQRFTDEFIRDTVLDIVFDVV